MSEWKEYKLSEIMEITGGGTPKTSIKEYWNGNIPWLSVVDFGNANKKVFDTEKKITESGLKNSSTKILEEGQIIISARGTVGELAVLGKDMAFNQSCYGLNAIPEVSNNGFLYYLMKCKISELKRNAHGAVFAQLGFVVVLKKELKTSFSECVKGDCWENVVRMQRWFHNSWRSRAGRWEKSSQRAIFPNDTITRSTFETIDVIIPNLSTQSVIAEILSSLDDKIELNNNINKELENLAQTLFKQWFIDFEFPDENGTPYQSSGGEVEESELGMIPKNWEVKKLSALIRLTGGGTPKRSSAEFWGGNIKWFSIQDIPNDSQVFVIDTTEKITELGLNKSSTKLLPRGTTIITARGTVGKLALVAEPMAMNQSCYGVNGASGLGEFYTYFNLKNAVEKLRQNVHGAVFDTITSNTFDTINSIYGNNNLANLFEEIVRPMMEQIENNCRENQELSNLRDTLLPKLISGEINVKDL